MTDPHPISLSDDSSYLKAREKNWHKGRSGHVLVVGGDEGMMGSVVMAGVAALRVGAGLVSLATRSDHYAAKVPEIMCHAIKRAKELVPLLIKADVIVIGSGLGQTKWAKTLWQMVSRQNQPLVIDADALTFLKDNRINNKRMIITPHPGEAARLLETSVDAIQVDRVRMAQTIQARFGGICVLKGAGTVVVDDQDTGICHFGNPGMASAGMGDVLSGVIGGLIAQSIPLKVAARLGVCIHAMAGDLAAKEGERGMIASDLFPYLRRLVNIS